ncbi:MAG: hypothetical protein WBF35_13185 [Candidatus Acidiferrales bacterium]
MIAEAGANSGDAAGAGSATAALFAELAGTAAGNEAAPAFVLALALLPAFFLALSLELGSLAALAGASANNIALSANNPAVRNDNLDARIVTSTLHPSYGKWRYRLGGDTSEQLARRPFRHTELSIAFNRSPGACGRLPRKQIKSGPNYANIIMYREAAENPRVRPFTRRSTRATFFADSTSEPGYRASVFAARDLHKML